MASSFSHSISLLPIVLLHLMIVSNLPIVEPTNHVTAPSSSSSESTSTKHQAIDLTKPINLFPMHNTYLKSHHGHVYNDDDDLKSSKMIEKKRDFQSLRRTPSIDDLGRHAAFFKIPGTKDARMFYFFFESRNGRTTDPVIIWLSGGMGCGSLVSLLYDNGPFHLTDNLTLEWNAYGWDKVANLIYVDQPIGTGYSHSSSEEDIPIDQKGVSDHLYNFLQAFFTEHPMYAENDFYIAGEGYAGHYGPALASRIQNGNRNNEGLHINLKGLAIGNGLTNSAEQFKSFPDYAVKNGLINQTVYDSLNSTVSECEHKTKMCDTKGNQTCLEEAYELCVTIPEVIMQLIPEINFYNIRKKCEGNELCLDFSGLMKFWELDSVKGALGVREIGFGPCNPIAPMKLNADVMRNLGVEIPGLLEDGIRVLVYVGEQDFMWNWIGNQRWVNHIEWSGQDEYLAAPKVPFRDDLGGTVGLFKAYGPLAFFKIFNAGHLVPMDAPETSLKMIKKWLRGKLG